MFDYDQPTLFAANPMSIDASFEGIDRRELAYGAWVEYLPGWLTGDERLFEVLRDEAEWRSPDVVMYDKIVRTPRLVARLDNTVDPIVDQMVDALSQRYGVHLNRVSAGLYRYGTDSVAWHGDRVARELPDALVCTVSLGGPRRFLLRPKEGGASIAYSLGHGDLVVMGGSCQRTWEHTIPKVARARARIALMFRHDYPAVPVGSGRPVHPATGRWPR